MGFIMRSLAHSCSAVIIIFGHVVGAVEFSIRPFPSLEPHRM